MKFNDGDYAVVREGILKNNILIDLDMEDGMVTGRFSGLPQRYKVEVFDIISFFGEDHNPLIFRTSSPDN